MIASQILVKFETKILINASCNLFLFNKASTDLNSGQLVNVARTTNQITHFGDFEASAVNDTTGSRKYHAISKIMIQRGRNNLFVFQSSMIIFS